jgi:hypothetical protein
MALTRDPLLRRSRKIRIEMLEKNVSINRSAVELTPIYLWILFITSTGFVHKVFKW